MSIMRNNKGITIITTVITVIILLILAGITITAVRRGMFDKAKDTVKTQQEREEDKKAKEEDIFEEVSEKPGEKVITGNYAGPTPM